MSSPSTPIASFKRSPFPHSWRPWSHPVDEAIVRRTACGLFNKMTSATIESIAGRFAELVMRVERSGDTAVVGACAESVVQRCVADPLRFGLLARLVQRAVDEAEGEDLRWRSVDPHYLRSPSLSMQSALRSAVLDRCQLALSSGPVLDALTLCSFVGELLVLSVLCCGDVQGLVDLLFVETEKNSDLHCLALCRILRCILPSTEASQIVEGLSLVEHVEGVLKEDSISLKIRYLMMDMLDQCLYPRPEDVFSSDVQRSEIYGFHLDDLDEDIVVAESPPALDVSISPPISSKRCRKEAQDYLASRNVAQAESFCRSLPPQLRYRFPQALVSLSLSSGDESGANAVALFLSKPSVQTLLRSNKSLAKAFEPDIIALEDTALDVPFAYHLMSIMLSAASLPQYELEDLASRIVVRENAARDRLHRRGYIGG